MVRLRRPWRRLTVSACGAAATADRANVTAPTERPSMAARERLRRRRSFVVTIGVALGLGAALAGCAGDSGGTDTIDPTTTDPGATTTTTARIPPPRWKIVPSFGLGDCLWDPRGARTPDGQRIPTLQVPCSGPHDGEVFAVVLHPAPAGLPMPSARELRHTAERLCLQQWSGFVGVEFALSQLELDTELPTAEGWAAGNRDLLCIVRPPAGEEVTGTLRGARR